MKRFTELYTQSPSRFTHKSIMKDTLVNLENFEYVMNNATICTGSKTAETDSKIIIMIHTARYNFDRRYAIRSTWGSIKLYRGWHLNLIFLLGIDDTSDPKSFVEQQLWRESKKFGDIIMGNFVDSYQNLTYKHLMG